MSSSGPNTWATINPQFTRDEEIGCLVTKKYADLPTRGSVDAIVSYFYRACKSPKFCARLEHAGFTNTTFHPNPYLEKGNPAYDKFAQALQDLERHACFGIAFHGTPTANIPDILLAGRDPNRHQDQLFGPDNSFSKDPVGSIINCRGGLEMIVFVVVLPSKFTQTHPTNNNSNHFFLYCPPRQVPPHPSVPLEQLGSPELLATLSRIPIDFLVIANHSHQLPLGTIKFRSVEPKVLLASQEKRQKFLQLSQQVHDKGSIAEEARVKLQIIQHLIHGQVDAASELYQREEHILNASSRKEIAWYVLKSCDEGLVDYLFPNLPDPMSPSELANANVLNVDSAIQDETLAIQELDMAKQEDGNSKVRNWSGTSRGWFSWKRR